MKKHKFLYSGVILFLLLILVLMYSLYKESSLYKIFDEAFDYKIAILQTSSAKSRSFISFFDKDLNLRRTQKIYFGGLSQCWDFPKVFNRKVFINIRGSEFFSRAKVLELDFLNNKYCLYDIKQRLNNCLAFSSENKSVYVANCTGDTNITCCDTESSKTQKFIIPNVYVTCMREYENKLFAFGNFFYPEPKSFIYIINSVALGIIKIIDISDCGFGQYDFIKINDSIFFTSQTQIKKNSHDFDYYECDNNILYEYNLAKNKIKKIELKNICPKQIVFYKDKLIISHDDWHGSHKNLSVYDLKTHDIKSIGLEASPYQIWLDEDKIYLTDRQKIFKYNADSFELEKKFDLETKKKYGMDFFISGFFVIQ